MAAVNLQEFEMAVVYAFQYASSSLKDVQAQQMKTQAENYCQKIKALPNGWIFALQLFEVTEHQQVKFFALQMLQEYFFIKGNTINKREMSYQIRTELIKWLQCNVQYIESKAPYLKTKIAVVITMLIKKDYPDQWPNCFNELMALLPLGPSMVEMYFRILIAINEEIVEYDERRTQEEANHNMKIKDAMRESNCMINTFDAIYNVLVNYQVSEIMQELSLSALETLKRYISWVDIGLIVNDKYLNLLFEILQSSHLSLRNVAANCLFEIIDKGMSPEKKMALIQRLKVMEILPTLAAIKEDDEFAEEIGEVVNGIGLELIQIMDAFKQQEQQNAEGFVIANQMLCQLMPLVWDLFAHEEKDVSEEVFEIVNAVGSLLRTEQSNSLFKPSEYIPQILHGIYRQTRYPEDVNAGDTAEFEEYRRSLYRIYINITRQRPMDTLGFITRLAQDLPNDFHAVDPRDLESFLSLVYRFKEGIAAVKTFQSLEDPNTPFMAMIATIHRQMIAFCQRPPLNASVLLTYYDLVVRYARVLQQEPNLIPQIFEMMFGVAGLIHENPQVRSRVCYLCLRLVKAIGSTVNPHVQPILTALGPRLIVIPQEEEEKQQEEAKKTASMPRFLPYDDQLYLFELAGQVIASLSSAGPQEILELKYQYTNTVLDPLLGELQQDLVQVNEKSIETIGNHCARVLNAMAHALKGFKGTNCMVKHQETFTKVLAAATCVLQAMPRHTNVRSKVIFTLHRLVGILEKEVFLTNVTETLRHLMMSCDTQDVVEVVQLLDQLIIKYKSDFMAFFDQALMVFIDHLCRIMPAIQSLSQMEAEVKDNQLLERENVQKYLYTFLLHITMHGLDKVFLTPRNVGQLENVLTLVVEGCTEVRDPNVNRGSFTIIHELTSRWLLPKSGEESPLKLVPEEVKAFFTQFVVTKCTPASFVVAKKQHFDLKDVQCASVIKEIATLQLVLSQAVGEEYVRYMQDVCLPLIVPGCPLEITSQYANQLRTGDRQRIINAYKSFVSTF